MSDRFCAPEHRALQDQFDTRRMADLMQGSIRHDSLTEREQAFIGGLPGFVRVVDERTLAFPSYDGNGMFMSTGNIAATREVGRLFIDFETPHRLRVQGQARLDRQHALMAEYREAQFMVLVAVTDVWLNCPRYVHKRVNVDHSKYVPQAGCNTPLPAWKRIDFVQELLPAKDQGRAAQAGGLITLEEYDEKVARGDA